MKAIFLAIVCAAIWTCSAHAKGKEQIEVTPESIERLGIPWEIRVGNTYGETSPDRVWFVSIYIKFRDGEKNWDAVPDYAAVRRRLAVAIRRRGCPSRPAGRPDR